MDFKNIIQSKAYKIAAISLAAILVLFLTFSAGMRVGFYKARFSYQWGENYHKNFAGPRNGMLRGAFKDFGGKDLIDSHGAAGQILKIDGPTLVIKGRDNVEKIVVVKEDTVIRRFAETIKLDDLKVDSNIVVIGEPNGQGQIEAKFIRTMPW